ncbi:hypothetical protein [Amycolatopsis sp. KNN50.9b]|uniref:hypothetical protein n=1 Tax=Amycolatopsis sp. KNN50.9b TaxID=2018303 RepID=UPI000B8B6DD6|nr:hypothetical protein [Amycolatopsis sp. KNN50.9b]OXM60946.1 hypothetical protein CF166_34800 [Amycolatopsis sp. KNN50.9b]
MEPTVDPLDTEPADLRGAALTALRGWAARRDRLAEDRADLMAAAWWSGTRTVAELARAGDVSRDTVYGDLRARGIEPTDKTAQPSDVLPPYAPIPPQALFSLARQAWTLVRPAQLTDRPGWLQSAAWNTSIALARIAVLLEQPSGADLAANAEDLVGRLGMALNEAQKAWAELEDREELALWSAARIQEAMDEGKAVVGAADLTLIEPGTGSPFAVQIGRSASGPAGWTYLRTEHPQLDTRITAADHLAIQTALHTLGRVLNSLLPPDEALPDDPAVSEPSPTGATVQR